MSITRDSVVVITGAGSGIGRALAVRFAAEQIAGIAIADVNAEGLSETREMMPAIDIKVTTHQVSVADEAAMREFADMVVAEHGRVTHVINNAGVALGGNLGEVSVEDIRWLMDVNFWGVVYGTKFFLPYLEREPSAHIVNLSSLFGLIAPPGQTAYCASKFAVRGFTESLRHELEDTNITVTTVHPGGVRTNIANSARIGSNATYSEEEIKVRRAKINRNLNRTSPAEAAEIIINGIKRRNTRILIGSDARILSTIVRLFPRRYFSVIKMIAGEKIKVT